MKINTYICFIIPLLCTYNFLDSTINQPKADTSLSQDMSTLTTKQIPAYTQTTAWLSLKTNRELRDKMFPQYSTEPYKQMIDKALVQEEMYKKTHYVFYFTLTPAIKIIQDLYSALYAQKFASSIQPGFPFLLLQTMDQKNFYDIYTDKESKSIVNAMITTNVSLFSNIESKKTTVNYFVHTSQKTTLEPWFFDFITELLALPNGSITSYKNKIQNVYETHYTKAAPANNNLLLQIFIPKEHVLSKSYITIKGPAFAWDAGVITKIILNEITNGVIIGLEGEELFTKAFERLVWVPDVLGKNADIKSKSYQQFKHAIDKDLEETAAFRTDPFLYAFINTPYIIAHSNTIEAKLLFPIQQIHIEAQDNMKLFTYSLQSEKEQKEYTNTLQTIVEQIMKTIKTLSSTPSKIKSSTPITQAKTKPTKSTFAQEQKKEQEKIRAELQLTHQKLKADLAAMRQSIKK